MGRISTETIETVNHYMKLKRFKQMPSNSKALFLSMAFYDYGERNKTAEGWIQIVYRLGYSKEDFIILANEGFLGRTKSGRIFLEDNSNTK